MKKLLEVMGVIVIVMVVTIVFITVLIAAFFLWAQYIMAPIINALTN